MRRGSHTHVTMPRFDIEAEPITVFHIGDEYIFSHYFEREDIFDTLKQHYNQESYRFEVPEEAVQDVCSLLKEEYFEPMVVEELEPYCVIKEKYTEHADILRLSVAHWERDDTLFFLLPDELTVREAIDKGATPIADTSYVIGL